MLVSVSVLVEQQYREDHEDGWGAFVVWEVFGVCWGF